MIFEIDLLDDEQLYYCQKMFGHLNFIDGSTSNPEASAKGNKQCKISYEGNVHTQLNNYVIDLIYKKIGPELSISRIGSGMFSKYRIGDFYNWHYDAVPMGNLVPHYSITCFLNDDYEGGELELDLGTSVSSYKLSAGKAIMYPTTYRHRVLEVTSGTRQVFIGWIESAIKNSFHREQYYKICDILNKVTDNQLEDWRLIEELNQLRSSIIRECP